jgi:hypothetical protein
MSYQRNLTTFRVFHHESMGILSQEVFLYGQGIFCERGVSLLELANVEKVLPSQ